MKMIKFGKTGLSISRIAFGGIPIIRLSKPEAAHLVRESINMGINKEMPYHTNDKLPCFSFILRSPQRTR